MTRGYHRARRGLVSRLLNDRDGTAVIVFSIALPVLCVLMATAIELSSLARDRMEIQAVADAAALGGAKELTLAMQDGAADRAEGFAQSELADISARSAVKVEAQVLQKGAALEVVITSHRTSLFGDLIPPGGLNIRVRAVAERVGRLPLCVLGSNESGAIDLEGKSRLSAGKCMVQANGSIDVDSNSLLLASAVQSVGEARGRISPQALVGGRPIDDPFTKMDMSNSGLCLVVTDVLMNLGLSIVPGVHCSNITVGKGQTLNLAPGEHYFRNGTLRLRENAKLKGKDVVLIFDDKSSFAAEDNAQIELEGRKKGKFSGFVIATTRANRETFEISSDSARKLVGAIYTPNATLRVRGNGTKVADQSPWTVIIAKSLEMTGSPDLVINANYTASDVPVPAGVGPARADSRLQQ